MVISPGGTSTTSVTSVQKTDHPLGPLGLGWNIASFPNADLHNVLVHQVVQQMSTFWWYPRYPWYLTKPVNQACVLCRTMLGYPFWGFFMFKRTVKPWLPWRIGWLTGYLLLGDLDMFDLDNSLIWTYLHRRSNLIPSPRSYQGSFLVVGWCWLELPMIQMHSTRHIYIYISLVPSWKFQTPSETVFWDLFLGSKHILKPELAAPALLFGHLSWNQNPIFPADFLPNIQTSKHPLDKSSATLSGSLFCPRPATQERS